MPGDIAAERIDVLVVATPSLIVLPPAAALRVHARQPKQYRAIHGVQSRIGGAQSNVLFGDRRHAISIPKLIAFRVRNSTWHTGPEV
jgi:hypothetical protein